MTMTKSHRALFEVARKVSDMSDYHRRNANVGCIVVMGNRVISSGFNTEKTKPIQKQYDRYRFATDTPHKCHAEIMALSPLIGKDIDFSRAKVYIYRCKANGQAGNARPCASCMALIKNLGIKHIYYTTDDGFCYEMIER